MGFLQWHFTIHYLLTSIYNIVSLHLEGRRICQGEEYHHLYPSRGGREDGTRKGQQVCWDFGGDHQCAQSLGDISPASTHLAKLHHCYLRDYYTLSPSWVGSWWSQVSKGMFIFYDLCLNEKNKISLVLCKWNWRQIC